MVTTSDWENIEQFAFLYIRKYLAEFSNMIHTQCESYHHETNMWSSYIQIIKVSKIQPHVVLHRNIIDQNPMQQGCSRFLKLDTD